MLLQIQVDWWEDLPLFQSLIGKVLLDKLNPGMVRSYIIDD